ncbi:SDR family oxidoreductase [Tenacibaculum sp. FZY0031]|uniref:dTDP-4-dehydrorhamnose reductase family protein n=1 Tax=Tenacibaculum sp. FZY0031 TaxID=3116648 RepID=UPI002ECC0607|nr:SDR family oxidoreductase [Tenacibaculum sp. FZY0031]
MKKKILVFGSMGMAGFTISTYLKERGHLVVGFARRKSPVVDTIIGDITDVGFVKKILSEGDYDYIVNCIGILNNKAEENKSNAVLINSFFPHLLADYTKEMKTKVIHMSTDCVFSGKKGSYSELDLPDGITFYDRTKALGELNDKKNITLRNSIIGPDVNKDGIGLFNWFMKNQKGGEISGYKQAFWTGLTTLELAKVIDYIINYDNNFFGLVNMVNNEKISKYELLILFNKYFKNNNIKVNENNSVKVDKSLLRNNFSIDYLIPSYEEMIREMSVWINSNKEFFLHYD